MREHGYTIQLRRTSFSNAVYDVIKLHSINGHEWSVHVSCEHGCSCAWWCARQCWLLITNNHTTYANAEIHRCRASSDMRMHSIHMKRCRHFKWQAGRETKACVLLLAGELNSRRPRQIARSCKHVQFIPITDFDEQHRQGSLEHFRGEVPSRGLSAKNHFLDLLSAGRARKRLCWGGKGDQMSDFPPCSYCCPRGNFGICDDFQNRWAKHHHQQQRYRNRKKPDERRRTVTHCGEKSIQSLKTDSKEAFTSTSSHSSVQVPPWLEEFHEFELFKIKDCRMTCEMKL